jgi:ABC-2 type transport system permease protein
MKLFLNYLSLHLKISLGYKSAFIMGLISQILGMFVELFTVYALFLKFKLLDIYNSYELLLGFSTLWLGYSIVELFARGFDHFSKLIVNGNFDILLIRPANLFIQICGSDICYEKTGRVLIALTMYIYSAIMVIDNFTFLKVLLLVLMVLGCIIIIFSIFIVGATFCFVTIQGLEIVNIFTNGTRQVCQYPIKIYNKVIVLFFSTIIPIALVSYYPMEYLTDKSSNILYVFMPMLTIIMFFISKIIFNIGLKKYCSTGS